MTLSDRQLLEGLRRQQAELQRSLARLEADLLQLEGRAGAVPPDEPEAPSSAIASTLPPVPTYPSSLELPPVPGSAISNGLPPIPAVAPLPPLPRPSLEFRFGRWLTAIGAIFGIFTLGLCLSLTHHYLFHFFGPYGLLGLSGLFSMGVVVFAQRLEGRDKPLLAFARTLLALGLAGLYLTLYAAHAFPDLQVITSSWVEGILLLLWSVYVLQIANRKRSQLLAFSAVALAYFSTAVDPIGRFGLVADLFLAGTAFVLLLHRGWASLSYISLVGVYLALLRRLVLDSTGHVMLDTSRALPFLPYAVYLLGAWGIFTAAVLLARTPSFRGDARTTFLSLNNAALVGLMTLTTYLSGYGFAAVGSTLFWIGILFLATALYAGGQRPDATFAEVSGAYFGQGIAALTGGFIALYNDVTRGFILGLEALFLGIVGGYSRSPLLKGAAAIVSLLATVFIVWEISLRGHRPLLLGFGGAAVMISNAWWARRAERASPLGFRGLLISSSYYCALAVVLAATGLFADCSEAALPSSLSFTAVFLTFLIYLFSIYELPPLAQALLLAAQALILFRRETGEALPLVSTLGVAFFTLVLMVWWPRQRVTTRGPWVALLNFVYAAALAGLAWQTVRPMLDLQLWMDAAALLSLVFLAVGSFARIWPLAVVGQFFLFVAVWHFFFPGGFFLGSLPWNGWAAVVPLAAAFVTGRAIQRWLRESGEVPVRERTSLRAYAYFCELLSLAMYIRLLLAIVPNHHWVWIFLLLGTGMLLWNVSQGSGFGARCSLFVTAIGVAILLIQVQTEAQLPITFLNGLGLLTFLVQPGILRLDYRRTITRAEAWLVILASSGASWLFVSVWVLRSHHVNYLTMGWALLALLLFSLGVLARERRQRWCGLALLCLAIARVFWIDMWGFSGGFKVLTFVVLTLITLGLGYVYARHADRFKGWL